MYLRQIINFHKLTIKSRDNFLEVKYKHRIFLLFHQLHLETFFTQSSMMRVKLIKSRTFGKDNTKKETKKCNKNNLKDVKLSRK